METLFYLKGQRVVSLAEADHLVQIIIKLTERTQKEVQILVHQLEKARMNDLELTQRLDDQIDNLMSVWRDQVSRLGGIPKGVWVVDFDHGQGYYCWKYPERRIQFCHGYKDGATGRKALHPETIEVLPAEELVAPQILTP